MSRSAINMELNDLLNILLANSRGSVQEHEAKDHNFQGNLKRLFSLDEPYSILSSLFVNLIIKFGKFSKTPTDLITDFNRIGSEIDASRKKARLISRQIEAIEARRKELGSKNNRSFNMKKLNDQYDAHIFIAEQFKKRWDELLLIGLQRAEVELNISSNFVSAMSSINDTDLYKSKDGGVVA